MPKYLNSDVKQKYNDYKKKIDKKLTYIKCRVKLIHNNDNKINHAHIGDIARIESDLQDIINYIN